MRIDYKGIERRLRGTGEFSVNHCSMPIGRPNKGQMKRLRERFPEWDIEIPKYDILAVYVDFIRKSARKDK